MNNHHAVTSKNINTQCTVQSMGFMHDHRIDCYMLDTSWLRCTKYIVIFGSTLQGQTAQLPRPENAVRNAVVLGRFKASQ